MAEKLTFGEFCAKGGRSRSAVKMEAARNNLEKAQAALAARRAARAESADKTDSRIHLQ